MDDKQTRNFLKDARIGDRIWIKYEKANTMKEYEGYIVGLDFYRLGVDKETPEDCNPNEALGIVLDRIREYRHHLSDGRVVNFSELEVKAGKD